MSAGAPFGGAIDTRMGAAMALSYEVIWLLDEAGTVTQSSPSVHPVLGYRADAVENGPALRHVHPDDQLEARDAFRQALSAPGVPIRTRYRVQHGDGGWRRLDVVTVNRLADAGVAAVVLHFRDITDIAAAQETEHALRERIKELRTLFGGTRILTAFDGASLGARLHEFIQLLPGGWQYPDVTTARLVLGDLTVATPGFRPTPWMLAVDVPGDEGPAGRLEVAVMEPRPDADEGPFLAEERELLEAFANVVGESVRHHRITFLHTQTIASIEEAVIMVVESGTGRIIADVNPAAEQMFGYTRAELLGQPPSAVHEDPVTYEQFRDRTRTALRNRSVLRALQTLRRSDGSLFDAEMTVMLLKPEEGMAGGSVSFIRDVSARRRAEAELHESEERFRLIAEHIDHVFWLRTAGSPVFDYVSPAYGRVWGRAPDELYTDAGSWLNHVLPSDRERARHDTAEHEWQEEYRIVRPDGAVRWILDRAFRVPAAAGDRERIVGVAEDITERRQLEQRFGVLSQEITDVVFVVATDGRIMLSSPSALTATGYSNAELDGSSSFDLVHPDDRARVMARFSAIVTQPGSTNREEYRIVTKEGDVRHVESVARNLIGDPAIGGILLTVRDVTERLDIEERMRQVHKLEAVGRLAGGIAHDFNNILTVIRSQTDLLLMDLPAHGLAGEVEVIQESADRAARLTAQLLAFSRDQVLRNEIVDVASVVRGMDRIIDRALGERITVQYDLPPDLPPVLVDPGQLEQVLMNLAVNARDAMPDGGTLAIMARAGVLPDGTGSTILEVRDTGVGMSDDVRAHIFEPFFTTKGHGKGTGLGLAMVYGVVTQSGGSVDVDTAPGMGTTFRLVLPAVHGAAGQPAAPEPVRAERSRKGATVLVIEDDPNVRRVTCTILRREGFDVTEQPDAEAGLVALPTRAWDVILTDLGLPGMSGRELAERVRAARPDTPIIVMSGYDVESEGERVQLPSGTAFIPKPFTRQTLLDAVRAALSGT